MYQKNCFHSIFKGCKTFYVKRFSNEVIPDFVAYFTSLRDRRLQAQHTVNAGNK